jgi:hypothetical protein
LALADGFCRAQPLPIGFHQLVSSNDDLSQHGAERRKLPNEVKVRGFSAVNSTTGALRVLVMTTRTKRVRPQKITRLMDEVYRETYRLEVHQPDAAIRLGIALVRAWIATTAEIESDRVKWLQEICPYCLTLLESNLATNSDDNSQNKRTAGCNDVSHPWLSSK